MKIRPLEWKANPNPKRPPPVEGEAGGQTAGEVTEGVPKLTKNQEKKLAKQRMIEEKKAAAAKEKAG
jgi:tryptophanyl-tRNA synthetase